MSVKGKTYEQIYGIEKAAELRALRQKNAISQMKVQRKGKTRKEIFGKEKADELKEIFSDKFSGKGNPNYQGGKVTINCANCNKEFEICNALKDMRKNCSQECYTMGQSKQIEFKCVICNKSHSLKPSKLGVKVCSRKCYDIWKRGENNPNWKGGKSFEPYNINWTKELRLHIRTRDNFTCQLCNMLEQESLDEMGRILTVHHIDYDKQNCEESNLITICAKCNTKVNGNRNYWANYFNSKIGELV